MGDVKANTLLAIKRLVLQRNAKVRPRGCALGFRVSWVGVRVRVEVGVGA